MPVSLVPHVYCLRIDIIYIYIYIYINMCVCVCIMILSDCVDYCVYKTVPLIFNISVQLCTVSDNSFLCIISDVYIYIYIYIYIGAYDYIYVNISELIMLSHVAEKWPIIIQTYSNIAATACRILQITIEKALTSIVYFVETSATVMQYLVKK